MRINPKFNNDLSADNNVYMSIWILPPGKSARLAFNKSKIRNKVVITVDLQIFIILMWSSWRQWLKASSNWNQFQTLMINGIWKRRLPIKIYEASSALWMKAWPQKLIPDSTNSSHNQLIQSFHENSINQISELN